jgi:glycosyltransferase involved in cell wall biosynthesis
VSVELTVGLPVFNGARTLRETLDSLMVQTFDAFELFVSDNASTDATPDILAEYAARDARIRIVRQPRNRGAIANLHYLLEHARTPLFTWFAADDVCAPTFLERTRGALVAHPGAIIAASDVCTTDERGTPRRVHEQLDTVGATLAQRINRHLATYGWYATYGVGRRERMLAFGPLEMRFGTDVIRTAEWILSGDVVRVPEPLFLFRERSGGKDAATYAALLEPDGPRASTRPHCHLLSGIGEVARRYLADPADAKEALDVAARTVAFENDVMLREVARECGVDADMLDARGRLRLVQAQLERRGEA